MFPRTSFLVALALFVTALPARAMDELIWRGDITTAGVIMQDLAKEYARQKKGRIRIEPFSTLSGLDAVANGTADIAGSARGKYAQRAQEATINFIPVALDAAVLVTHPKNPVTTLTLRQIHDVYFGRIKNWKELGGPDKPINLYAIAAPLDGVEYSLRELVYRKGNQPIAAPRLYLNTAKLEEAVTIDPYGLGLTTLARAHANKKLKMLSVEGVTPSMTTVSNAAYPLFITLYLAERDGSPKHDAIMRFLAFLDTQDAKRILRKYQLIPYADAGAVVARHDQRMTSIDQLLGRKPPQLARPHPPAAASAGAAPSAGTALAQAGSGNADAAEPKERKKRFWQRKKEAPAAAEPAPAQGGSAAQ